MNLVADATEPKRSEYALGESDAKFRLLFEKSPDAMLLLDGEVFIDCNQAAVEMMHCSSRGQLLDLHPYDISPERQPDGRLSTEKARDMIATAFREGSLRFEWVHRAVDGTDFPVEVLLTTIPLHGEKVLHVAWRDITERKRTEEALQSAYQTLELRVEERTREIERRRQVAEGLRDILKVLNPNRPLDEILDYIVGQASRLLGANAGVIYRLEVAEELIIVEATCGMPADFAAIDTVPFIETEPNRATLNRRPFAVPDLANRLKTVYPDDFEWPPGLEEWAAVVGKYFCAYLSVPLIVRDKVYGAVSLYYHEPREFSDEEIQLAVALGDQAALAIENALLHQAEQNRLAEAERRREVAEGLRDVVTILNSNRPLTEILDCIVAQAGRLMSADAVAIYRLQGRDGPLQVQASSGLPADFVGNVSIPVGQGVVGRAVLERRPVAFSDMTAPFPDVDDMMSDPQQQALVMRLVARYRSALGVPLIVEGRVYGGIVLYYPDVQEYSDEDIGLVVTFADQTALAIENAGLREQVEQAAVLAERSRLARDLHDAVTQTLFSAGLIAEVLPRIWERNQEEGRRRLEELRELTRGALAEMRTLLLELRPSALVDAPVDELLRQLGESITGRVRVPVTVEVEGECALPPEVKVALYRIAQEALNNVAKHANASRASVSLRCQPGQVVLCVSDDGRGFDPQSIPPESLGMGIMRERAKAIGAALEIETQLDHGTRVVVTSKDERRMTKAG